MQEHVPPDTNRRSSSSRIWRPIWITFCLLYVFIAINLIWYGLPYVMKKLYSRYVIAMLSTAVDTSVKMHTLVSTYSPYETPPPELIRECIRLTDEHANRVRRMGVLFKYIIVPPRYKDVNKMCIEYVDLTIRMCEAYKQYLQNPNPELRSMWQELTYYVNGLADEISLQLAY